MMNLLLLQLFNGISLSSVLLLIALGLAVTFGLMNVINMAHGEFIMIGAYMAYLIQSYFQKFLPASAFGWYFVLSLGASFLVAFAVGWLLETVLIRFLYGRPLDSLLATWGVSLVLQQLARQIFGAPNVAVKSPAWLEGALTINADLMLPYKRLFIIALAAVCMLVIYFYLYRTAGGRRLRAVMQNRPMGSCLGISTRRIDAQSFAFGSGIAGVAAAPSPCSDPLARRSARITSWMRLWSSCWAESASWPGLSPAPRYRCLGHRPGVRHQRHFGKVLVFTLMIAFLQWKPAGLFTVRSRQLD